MTHNKPLSVDDPMILSPLLIKNDVDFTIKFYVTADFNNHQQVHQETMTYPPSLPYTGTLKSLHTELLQMFEEDDSEKFIIEAGGEEIAVLNGAAAKPNF